MYLKKRILALIGIAVAVIVGLSTGFFGLGI
jgi:hypothetical protein